MKKLLSLFAILSLVSGMAFAYDEGTAPHRVDSVGGPADTPFRVYRLVRYAQASKDAVGLSAGDVVVWDLVSDDGVTVNLSDAVGLTGSSDAVAGVVVGNNSAIYSTSIPSGDVGNTLSNDVGRRNWGYIQTEGLNTNTNIEVTSGGTATAGLGLRGSARPRYACAVQASGDAGSLGFSYDTQSSTGAGNETYIRA